MKGENFTALRKCGKAAVNKSDKTVKKMEKSDLIRLIMAGPFIAKLGA